MEPQKRTFDWLDVASAVHELKNPAETLTTVLYLLQQNPGLDADGRKYVKLAKEEVERLHYTINETLARYRELANPTMVSVSGILDAVLRFSDHKIAFKQIQVEKRYECNALVNGHPEDLRQVFANLVVNAVEALRLKGKLVIHTCQYRQSDTNCAGVRVVIADNGSGISTEHHGKVFQQSFTTKGPKGTGLGLRMSANLIHQHGGTIRFRSSTRPNRSGTVFSVFLPVAQAENYRLTDGTSATDQFRCEKVEELVLSPKVNRATARMLRAEHRHLLAQIRVQRERYTAHKMTLISR